jgi:hypothetical protein
MSQKQKESVLKVLNGLLNNNKINRLRQVINKFRLNRKIIDIQKHFIKRFLMSKAGLAQIAFRAFASLPERKNRLGGAKGSKFEAGLVRFATRTLSRAFGAFKNEF